MIKVAVTFGMKDDQHELLESILKDKAEIKFLNHYDRTEYEKILSNSDILFSWNPPKELKDIDKDHLKNIKFVQLLSAGFDHIDFNWFPPNCKIASNKGAYAEPMAEHIIAMILAIYKNLFANYKKLAAGKFNQSGINRSLKDSKCGILGFGGIGKATANLLKSFGTKIYAINTTGKTGDNVDFIGTLNDLKFVLEKSDIIVISLPLNKETDGLINKARLELMNPNAVLINVARGEIIVEKDLYEHLKSHPQFSAGIDAWWIEPFTAGKFKVDYPFFDLPNFLGSPHNSAIVPGIFLHGTETAAKNILKFIEGEKVDIINKG